MLESLHVKNLALIKESEVFFYPGLNILSGETGAGKSIILGSIRLALGAKAGKDLIRNGEEYALIELIFKSSKPQITEKLKEFDLPVEEDGTVFIQRKIMDGRSSAKINGETVSGKALKQIASLLINIHGQNDTAELLDSKNYLDILDEYAFLETAQLKERVSDLYETYTTLKKEFEDNQNLDKNRDKELALARFEVQEIDTAALNPGEDDELEDTYRLMNNSKKIVDGIQKSFYSLDGEGAASDSLDHALRELRSVLRYDEKLSDMESNLATACDLIEDCKRNMDDYMAGLEFSESDFLRVENRLDTINHLKSKYGNSIEDILTYRDDKNSFIEKMSDFSSYMEQLQEKVSKAKKELLSACRELSQVRKGKAQIMAEELIRNLKELNLEHVKCEVCVDPDEDNLNDKGYDTVDFMVSFNVGEPQKSLGMIASGGELSRFMLALKAITADKESIETLIFDEIDAGISGKTAWNVAEKMDVIARQHQVIAITHLPQIAAMADSHYLIEKSSDTDRTQTDIVRLSYEKSIDEIARLMSTDTISTAVKESAKELKAQALASKRL